MVFYAMRPPCLHLLKLASSVARPVCSMPMTRSSGLSKTRRLMRPKRVNKVVWIAFNQFFYAPVFVTLSLWPLACQELEHPETEGERPKKRQKIHLKGSMSPATKARIEEQRLEKKREQSRKWHQKFSSKGVSSLMLT